MTFKIPNLSLVLLIGPSGSGKSTFARKHFLPTEVLSSDACRGMVSDDENDQAASKEAFEVLQFIAGKRLARGKMTVIDATNVQAEARKPLVALARQHHCLPVALVLDLPEKVCHERNQARPDRDFGPHVVRNQTNQLRRSLRGLRKEGFRYVFVMETPAMVDAASVERIPLWNDRRDEPGPFDIIGDVHGCCDELELILERLGYAVTAEAPGGPSLASGPVYAHPEGRKAIFLGDLVDRGPRVLDVIRLVRNMVLHGSAHCVPGNHDVKLVKKLLGKNVQITHGLAETLAEIEALPDELRAEFSKEVAAFLDSLVSHYVLDGGRLVVAHAGMREELQGRGSGKVRDFALYGETTGETDEFGLSIRYDWAKEYRGSAQVVYGHTPIPAPEWLNRTVNIDTGCVFGGKLTALRYPEGEFVAVPAARTYCEPTRPFLPAESQAPASALSAQQSQDQVLDAEDVLGKRIIPTRLRGNVTIREANAVAALEVMSRFAVDPRWLIYLPPTMSPCETSREAGLLEHPAEAFAYYRSQGAPQVVCEEKHMGSRAVVVLCRDEAGARERFGVTTGELGIVTTRTGRRFFNDLDLERRFLDRVRSAFDATDLWDQLKTTWACLDCELMPWSAKAQELLRTQYAAVGAAGSASLPPAIAALERAASRLNGAEREKGAAIEGSYRLRGADIGRFVAAYRQYCWTVNSLTDLKLAPFHLLATEGHVHTDKDHPWHMKTMADLCRADPELLRATPSRVVDVTDPASQAEGIAWWEELTSRGGEGMVVKPLNFIHRGPRGLSQPAVKCRGREYLRIIYGPDYTTEENLVRLRSRGLGRKRSLALGEFALGVEALERFVRKEPLRRVHECVFGVLALESEPVDPRL
ncbi:polynucleotide 3'-phosphatase /polynucleotide 5'-hydroxyl-kinase /polynucleotide 2',3'-cyclic phosphate phosphodiesterase [Singulisphaera sp. GP187]|uniref:polynucleotide kinase-phosphatase n=1 Tax=Singulisphaera sp. GP187 TaxID=1882752 RepID=UPI0009297149|nr:polynucleotide kinase-phosphatase [Singulisphaera sp. GP187]SIO39596.1 polynucleotide 3'-phosphatase /polynucleotide 5'-hydroxyl-kinase /polynucleotide 2',3'-cyclic phosphate phosphodiesterase [Singulisphaera sp. GP187]